MSTSTLPELGDGLHPNLPFEQYLQSPRWGSSSLRAMRRGPPARVMWERTNPTETAATRFGTAVHCAFLTPDLFHELYAVRPEGMDFRTKDGKAWREEHSDRIILSYEDEQRIGGILAALGAKEPVEKTTERGEAEFEVSLYWTCPYSTELCKSRPDWIQARYHYDLKVSRHADGPFPSLVFHAYAEGWMHQQAHGVAGGIALGHDIRGARIVVVSPKAPHYVHCLEVKPDALDLLALENVDTLRQLGSCREVGEWPGTPDAWQKIEPPASAVMKEFGALTGAVEEVE